MNLGEKLDDSIIEVLPDGKEYGTQGLGRKFMDHHNEGVKLGNHSEADTVASSFWRGWTASFTAINRMHGVFIALMMAVMNLVPLYYFVRRVPW